MRRHAKASTAGLTKRRARGFGRFFRGAFAPRGSSLAYRGSGAPAAKRLLIPVGAVAAIFALMVAAAPVGATPDTVVTMAATTVSQTAATLNGTVNPEGIALTACEFEWGTTTAYGETTPCEPDAADIGSGTSAVPVSADISGLDVGTIYHFRLRAVNANGPILGADESLQTTGPVIKVSWSEGVVFTEATLRGKINPAGSATTFKFEWGPTSSYGQETEIRGVGSDEADHSVSAFLEGLQPGSTYHYRLVATNSAATNDGLDQTFTTFAHVPQDTSCSNQVFRIGPGADLPDCRAYEMVSPVDKNGGAISTLVSASGVQGPWAEINQASVTGNKYTYSSYKPFAGAPGAPYTNQYIATRNSDGWSTEPISPARANRSSSFAPDQIDVDGAFRAFNDDLSQSWLLTRSRFALAPNAIPHFPDIYRRDADGTLHAVTTGSAPPPGGGEVVRMSGLTPDGSVALFEATAALTPDANNDSIRKVYESKGGQLQLISVLPNGEAPTVESLVGGAYSNNGYETAAHGGINAAHAISDDGSRIFWSTIGGNSVKLYVRVDGTATIPVSQGEEAYFWTANPSGSKVIYGEPIYTQQEPLGSFEDLYEFDVNTETRSLIATEVRGVLGASKDLSYLYFVSKDDLAPGATEGERNLYLDHEGQMRFIATLDALDTGEAGNPNHSNSTLYPNAVALIPSERRSRVTADGHDIAFMSMRSLTGYDNTDAVNGKPDFEVFNYNADANELTCVSCNPTGERPTGRPLELPYNATHQTVYIGGFEFPAAAWLPSWENSLHASRVLSEDGTRLFFNSFDALVPGDSNGRQDLYEWEAQGTGSCHKAEGCIGLISTGNSPVDSEFLEATPDGGDVFFRTESSIDPRDPNSMDVYDARVEGGFAPPPPPPPACVGDACQAVPPAPGTASLASASFHGAGNQAVRKPRHSCNRRPRGGRKARTAVKHSSAKRCRRGHGGRRTRG